MSKHRVRTHHWHDGILKTADHWFDDLKSAMDAMKDTDAYHVKIYNPENQLVHDIKPSTTQTSTYA